MAERSQTSRVVSAKATTFTLRRMDTIVARYYSLALVLSGVEMYSHVQEQAGYLNAWFLYPAVGLIFVSILGMLLWSWIREYNSFWYLLHAAAVVLNLAAWPWAVQPGAHFPADFTPYFWWSLGWGAMSAGLGLRLGLAATYIVVVPLWFAYIQTSAIGGGASLARAAQDAVYTVLISAVLTAMVQMLRYRAMQQDLAFESASRAAAAEAASNAVANERLRVGSLVHNQVLAALNAAIEAYSPDQEQTAQNLASSAIRRLSDFESEVIDFESRIPVSSFFESLGQLIQQQDTTITVSTEVEGNLDVPVDVASALSEATMQAVANSLMHAGPKVTRRRVKLRYSNGNIKITIVDDGRGFRPSRVPKNRLGIRTLIFKRINQLGGEAKIQSSPGEGTNVILQWEAK